MTVPMISVVMPVYNGEVYLREAIDSILGQNYQNFEFIILNDGSTDKTEEIILSYSDPRIVYIKNEQNLQIVKTLNKGIKLAKGKYIARMDADDISFPERFEKQYYVMEKNKNIGVCGTWAQTFGEEVKFIKPPKLNENIKASLVFDSSFVHPSVMMRKSVLDLICYDKKFQSAEDYALWIVLLQRTDFYNIPEILFKYRLHESKTVKHLQLNSANELRKIMSHNMRVSLEESDLNLFLNIASNKKVNIIDVERILIKITKGNAVSNFVDSKALEEVLKLKYWKILNNKTHYNFSLYFHYMQSPFKKSDLPFFIHLKFIMKCLLGYSNEK